MLLPSEHLESEKQRNEDVDEGSSGMEGSPRAGQPTPCITTCSKIKKDFLEEWRAQYANQTQVTERCVTTEAQVRDITKKLSSLVQPMDYYPLLVFQVSSDEVPTVRL